MVCGLYWCFAKFDAWVKGFITKNSDNDYFEYLPWSSYCSPCFRRLALSLEMSTNMTDIAQHLRIRKKLNKTVKRCHSCQAVHDALSVTNMEILGLDRIPLPNLGNIISWRRVFRSLPGRSHRAWEKKRREITISDEVELLDLLLSFLREESVTRGTTQHWVTVLEISEATSIGW